MATSSSTAAHDSYDIFINHRGPDVKNTFASHLYQGLLKHGLRVFLDKPEMQPGDSLTSQIESAVRTASVHVAVFSPGYAESSWCLNELLLMLESGKTIIPVFYHVTPAELRWTQGKPGKYADALQELSEKKTYDPQSREWMSRYNSTTIEEWRNGLSRVSEISGFELEMFNSDEGKLVENVVRRVLKKVAKTPLHVAKYPKGLDEKVYLFENEVLLQQQQREKPPVLGIVGLGGVGKTTLAKELFNRKSSDYSRCCFLPDVRDNAGKGHLISLQRKLLEVLTGSDLETDSVIIETLLKKRLSSSQIFLVLDDVDHVEQVDALVPDQTVIRSDSLVLITSRNKDILTSSGIENSSIYKLTGLSEQHSLELFCSHAFKQPYPPSQFEFLVNKFLEACGGLPLSLKVFGALLCGKNKQSYWEEQLDKLGRILPKDIKKSLQISVDALDSEEREIFLDIACIFIGEDRDMAVRIWDGCNWKGFQNLEERCLVEVDSKNVIHMHDHLRDLGRDIAEAPGLVRGTDNLDDLLQPSSVITEVRGIRTVQSNIYDDEHANGLSEMIWHRGILQIPGSEDGLLERILTRLHSPNLLWLCWYNCPYSSLPSWIPVKNLRVLQVHGKEWTSLWEGECQAPSQLRDLEIKGVLWNIHNSIGRLEYLERINILEGEYWKNPHKIVRLPEEFCRLRSLKTLLISNCGEIKSFPDSFGDLRNLGRIELSSCTNLERLPETFGNLVNLRRIFLSGCEKLEMLPESFGNLINLRRIFLSGCKKLEMLPESFGNLNKLEYLDLINCSKLTISSEAFRNISTLQHINLAGCAKIEVLPLKITQQRSLKELNLWQTNLKELPSAIRKLSNLENLYVGSPLLDTLPSSLGNLSNLKKLTLRDCKELKCLPASVGRLTQLTELSLWTCPIISELPDSLCNLSNLKALELLYWPELKCLPDSVGRLTQLTQLNVSSCPIRELPHSLGELRNLKTLELMDCKELKCFPASVGQLTQLIELRVWSCPISELHDSLGDLRKLKTLELVNCKELKCLPASVAGLTQLTELKVECCSIHELLRSLGDFCNLKVLSLSKCKEFSCLPASVGLLTQLNGLRLELCPIRELPNSVGDLRNLKRLELLQCKELKCLPASVGLLTQLTKLRVEGCPELTKLRELAQCRKLRELNVSGCSELEDLEGVEQCTSLRFLIASDCPKLRWGGGVTEQLHQRLKGRLNLGRSSLPGGRMAARFPVE